MYVPATATVWEDCHEITKMYMQRQNVLYYLPNKKMYNLNNNNIKPLPIK